MNRVVANGFLEDTCALLERTPRAIRELLAGLPDSWLGEPDVVAGWTARDVVGHLISAVTYRPIADATLVSGLTLLTRSEEPGAVVTNFFDFAREMSSRSPASGNGSRRP